MLGYRGRSNRRDFIGGCALLVVAPIPIGRLWDLSAGWLGSVVDKGAPLAMIVLLAAGLLSLALLGLWLWGATVLLMRRARDIGWPAWAGLLGAAAAAGVAYVFGPAVFFALLGLMAVVPGRQQPAEAELRASAFG